MLTEHGSVIKTYGEEVIKSLGTRKASGIGVRFSTPEDPDYDNEFFTVKSVLGLRNGASRPYMMEHGYAKKFGKQIVGMATYELNDEVGWEYEVIFSDDKIGNKAYAEIQNQRYKSSAGAAWNTVSRTMVKNAFHNDTWYIAEQSATKFPNDASNPPVVAMKNLAVLLKMEEMINGDNEFFVELIKAAKEKNELMKQFFTEFKDSFKVNEIPNPEETDEPSAETKRVGDVDENGSVTIATFPADISDEDLERIMAEIAEPIRLI